MSQIAAANHAGARVSSSEEPACEAHSIVEVWKARSSAVSNVIADSRAVAEDVLRSAIVLAESQAEERSRAEHEAAAETLRVQHELASQMSDANLSKWLDAKANSSDVLAGFSECVREHDSEVATAAAREEQASSEAAAALAESKAARATADKFADSKAMIEAKRLEKIALNAAQQRDKLAAITAEKRGFRDAIGSLVTARMALLRVDEDSTADAIADDAKRLRNHLEDAKAAAMSAIADTQRKASAAFEAAKAATAAADSRAVVVATFATSEAERQRQREVEAAAARAAADRVRAEARAARERERAEEEARAAAAAAAELQAAQDALKKAQSHKPPLVPSAAALLSQSSSDGPLGTRIGAVGVTLRAALGHVRDVDANDDVSCVSFSSASLAATVAQRRYAAEFERFAAEKAGHLRATQARARRAARRINRSAAAADAAAEEVGFDDQKRARDLASRTHRISTSLTEARIADHAEARAAHLRSKAWDGRHWATGEPMDQGTSTILSATYQIDEMMKRDKAVAAEHREAERMSARRSGKQHGETRKGHRRHDSGGGRNSHVARTVSAPKLRPPGGKAAQTTVYPRPAASAAAAAREAQLAPAHRAIAYSEAVHEHQRLASAAALELTSSTGLLTLPQLSHTC